MRLTRARDVDTSTVFYQILLIGFSGSGKTWKGAEAAQFAILLEKNGVNSALHANPDLMLPTFDDEEEPSGVRHYCKTLVEVDECLQFARSPEGRDAGIKTILIDGFTEIQQMKKAEMLTKGSNRTKTGGFTKDAWGRLKDWASGWLRKVRDLPVNVVMTALAEYSYDADQVRWIEPHVQGSIGADLIGFFTVAAYCFEAEDRHFGMFSGTAQVRCKKAHPLHGVVDAPVSAWFDAMRSGEDLKQASVNVPYAPRTEAERREAAGAGRPARKSL